jgi:thiamine pyrophosphate-dependent acetolactate synthase large subunit-like protein
MPDGGELLVRGLEAAGVQVVFGLPGVHNLAAWRAFSRSSIRLVGVRHEQAAVYAADGYARATGRLGVAITTTGPGAANTLGAVGEAWASGSPVLVIATDIPRSLRREGVYRGVLHECTDQAGMFAPVTKTTIRVTEPAEVLAAVQIAAFHALDAPTRPVYLEIPTDTLSEPCRAPTCRPTCRRPAARALRRGPRRAAAVLAAAERPLIWVGGGALRSQAGPEVAMLAERLAAPVLRRTRRAGCSAPITPARSGSPRICPRSARCGTPPTSSSPWARTSTG